jgi:hypothetical protein
MVCQFAALNVLRLNWMSWSSFVPAGPDSSAENLPFTPRVRGATPRRTTVGDHLMVADKCPRVRLRTTAAIRRNTLSPTRGRGNNRSSSVVCQQCGIDDDSDSSRRYMQRTKQKLCTSCRAKPSYVITTKAGKCRPWRGETDEDLNPIDNHGNLVLAGIRSCGYKDCMSVEHVISEPDVIAIFRCRHRHITSTLLKGVAVVDIPPCNICAEPTSMVSRETDPRSKR